jgi:dTDP-4-dehydrorhamnose reductase
VGVNYYVTSERCLDEDLGRYPLDTHGGNGRQSYADVAAVQGCPERVRGVEKMVQEVWDRYGLPLAITESHLGCTRDEQVRWLMESWRAGQNLCRRGVDLRAVTAWALLGAFDWNSLVTTEVGVYEPGAFDVRSGQLRPTLLAKVIQQLAQTRRFEHPILCDAGWWHRAECQNRPAAVLPHFGRPILILGGAGNLARALERVCHVRGLSCRNLSRHQADVCQLKSLQRCLEIYRPWAVVNASGYTFIEEAETDRDRCFEVNEVGARNAARVCAAAGIPYVAISSDLVFGGEKMEPYVESDEMRPRSVFGMSKQQGERAVLGVYPGALVIRTSTLFDPWSLGHFAAQVLLQESPLILPEGRISPTFTVDLCQGLLDLLIDDESGVWHLANEGSVTWVEFAQRILEAFSLPARELHGKAPVAPRPQQSVLRSEKGSLMPSLDDAVVRFARDFQPMLGTAGRHEAAVG